MRYFALATIILTTPVLVFAQGQMQLFQPGLPGLQNAGNLTTQQYIDALYVIAITAAAILAVFKLIWAGVQYMLSDLVTSKQKAKQDIQGALLGLLIILAAVTILTTINPNLKQINFLKNATPANSVPPNNSGVSGSNTNNNSGTASQGSWQEAYSQNNANGDTAGMWGGTVSDRCRNEGGSPQLQYSQSGDLVSIFCKK